MNAGWASVCFCYKKIQMIQKKNLFIDITKTIRLATKDLQFSSTLLQSLPSSISAVNEQSATKIFLLQF